MKKTILSLLAIAALSVTSFAPSWASAQQPECGASIQAKELALYILNDNLRYFANHTVQKKTFTMEEIFGSQEVHSVQEVLSILQENRLLKQTYRQINATMTEDMKNLPQVITIRDIKYNLPAEPFCNE